MSCLRYCAGVLWSPPSVVWSPLISDHCPALVCGESRHITLPGDIYSIYSIYSVITDNILARSEAFARLHWLAGMVGWEQAEPNNVGLKSNQSMCESVRGVMIVPTPDNDPVLEQYNFNTITICRSRHCINHHCFCYEGKLKYNGTEVSGWDSNLSEEVTLQWQL